MISTVPTHTIRLLLLIGIYYLIIVSLYWKKNVTNFDSGQRTQMSLILCVLIHLVFAFDGGDYFNYYGIVALRNFEDGAQEPFYSWLADLLDYNYLLWRLVVWGGALLLFAITARRFALDPYKVVFLLYVMYINLFDYARATLGMAMFLFGLSFWCVPIDRYKFFSYLILGPLFMYASTFLHSSMLIACAASVVVFIKMGKTRLLVTLIVFSLLVTTLFSAYQNLLSSVLSSNDEYISNKAERYSSQEYYLSDFSTLDQIRKYWEYATIFLPAFISTFNIFQNKERGSRSYIGILRLYNFIIGVFFVAILLLSFTQTIAFFYRILYMSFMSSVILLFFCRKEGIVSKRLFNAIIYICLLHFFFRLSKFILGGSIPW